MRRDSRALARPDSHRIEIYGGENYRVRTLGLFVAQNLLHCLRISNGDTLDLCPRGYDVRLAFLLAHDVLHVYITNQQGIANERPVTTPWNRLCTHNCCSFQFG